MTVATPPDAEVDGPDTSEKDVAARLQSFVAAQLAGAHDLQIDGLRRTSSGFSRENWEFDASWRDGDTSITEQLIMRRDPVGSVLETERRGGGAPLGALAPKPHSPPPPRRLAESGA